MRALIIVLLLLVVVAVAVGATASSRRRRAGLRTRFGPEYDRAVAAAGSTREAETDLDARERHRASYQVRPLTPEARLRYRDTWMGIQTAFIDEPDAGVRNADKLLSDLLAERGYPIQDRDQLLGDLSVDLAPEHADTLERFRGAHEIYVRNERREATTEDLRRAMQQYRALLEELAAD
jgi:hypothetical protein